MQESWDQSLDWEEPLEKGMTTHFSSFVWRIPWTEEPSHGPWGHKVGMIKQHTHSHRHTMPSTYWFPDSQKESRYLAYIPLFLQQYRHSGPVLAVLECWESPDIQIPRSQPGPALQGGFQGEHFQPCCISCFVPGCSVLYFCVVIGDSILGTVERLQFSSVNVILTKVREI